MRNIKLIIADDHPIFLMGLRQVLQSNKHFELLGEAKTGEEALEITMKLNPDIVILDLDMPRLNAFEVAKQLIQKKSSSKLIILTMHDAHDLLAEALALGIKGYVLKENALTDIVMAVEKVFLGEHFISPLLSNGLIEAGNHSTLKDEKKLLIEKLTNTEKKILSLIAHQKTTKEIAEELFISYRTVEKHRSNICDKLNITGNNALLKFALEHKDYF